VFRQRVPEPLQLERHQKTVEAVSLTHYAVG
jgi:hypothetical protein